MAYMAHKVPNTWSFAPRLSNLLENHIQPPYKVRPTSLPRLVLSTRVGNHVKHHYAHAGPVLFRNNGGVLKAVAKRKRGSNADG